VEAGAQVINISGGQAFPPGGAHPLLAEVFRLCEARGVLVVAAAGNDGCECLHLPAALPGVLTVGALDRSGRPLDFSNWGQAYRAQGIMAPGEAIPAARAAGGVEPCRGTSYATALVSGIAALLISLRIKLGLEADPRAVGRLLLETADGCEPGDSREACRRLLSGRVNVDAALRSLKGHARIRPATARPTSGLGSMRLLETRRPGQLPSIQPSSSTPTAVYPIGRVALERLDERDRPARPPRSRFASADFGAGLAELDRHPWPTEAIVWTLEVDAVPVYAVEVEGPFAVEVDRRLRRLYREQVTDGSIRVAMPGSLHGEQTLPSGLTVPLIQPELRGMTCWIPPEVFGRRAWSSGFFEALASGRRNLGATAADRALNFCWPMAATSFEAAVGEGMELDSVAVNRPFGPPGQDRWSVDLIFYRPVEGDPATRRVHRFTVDLGDVIPSLVDGPRIFSIR